VPGVGAYPGTFNPPTVAHLAIAEAAWRQGGLDRVDLVVSRRPFGKDVDRPTLDDRMVVLQAIASSRPWLGVRLTDAQLIADVAAGYDAVVVGADKWLQIMDPGWYAGSSLARDEAVAGLPRLLLVVRPPYQVTGDLPAGSVVLEMESRHANVSSSGARAGQREWMAIEAAESGHWPPTRPDLTDRAD
jgi:nicotinamide-nucleotide adenylyltransferase